jgi:hypothetical protein
MTVVAERAPQAAPARTAASASTVTRPRAGARRVALACLVLVLAYVALSFLDDPRGSLGSDTGAKVATIRVMGERNTIVPGLGYWAERYDPDGDLHPMYNSAHIGRHWVNVTTLPMLVVSYPLYELGGLRALLLLPMVGGVLTALAARALARRLRGGDGWWAFWAIGLATPIVVYALDFWEHALGVAAMVWAFVLVHDVVDRRAGWRGAVAAGALFGLAATMRTEALVYALVGVGALAVPLVRRGRAQLPWFVSRAIPLAAGVGAVVVANQLLERAVIGGGLRAGRASATAADAAGGPLKRIEEALTTTFGLTRFPNVGEWALGGVLVVAMCLAVWAMTRGGDRARRIAVVAVATVAFA